MLGFGTLGQFALGEAQSYGPIDISVTMAAHGGFPDSAEFGINVYDGGSSGGGSPSARVSLREIAVSNTSPTSIREQ